MVGSLSGAIGEFLSIDLAGEFKDVEHGKSSEF
jgi:hypothetical protein